MTQASIQTLWEHPDQPAFDRWLRFVPAVQARYDQDQGAARARDLRSAILIGLCFVHVYNITSFILTPDIALVLIWVRVLVFTPMTLILYWLVGRGSPRQTELLVLGGMVNAALLSLSGFWFTQDPDGSYTFGEMFLSVVYANMLLALRFPHAVLFTFLFFLLTALAIMTKAGLEPVIQTAFIVQMGTACAFALCANYRLERRRCDSYVQALSAMLEAEEAAQEAEEAQTARHTFQILSRTDALTGLPNRRHLSETIEDWWATPDTLALLMIDVDHFKLYNDRLGHLVGDACLRRVADVLAWTVQDTDAFCARFGGEEFTVLLRVRGEEDVAAWAGRLVEAVDSAAIPHPARPDSLDVVTVSIGAAIRRDAGTTSPERLFALADSALYAAKQHGRNGFALYEESVSLRRIA